MTHKSESGQILVLVLLIVLVAMTIGLSVASRTLTTVRNQADLTMSNRAFSAAEAGVERALLQIKQGGNCNANSCIPDIAGVETQVELQDVGGQTNRAFGVASLGQDDVLQADLRGYTGRTVSIYWGDNGDSSQCQQSPALVASVVYQSTSTNEYGVLKVAEDRFCGSSRSSDNGFNSSLVTVSPNPTTPVTLQDESQRDSYGYSATMHLNGPASILPPGTRPVGLRVRLMYAGSKPVAIAPHAGQRLPLQGQQITSTSIAGGQQRTIKVLRTDNALPAIFDYALFNGSTSTLSK